MKKAYRMASALLGILVVVHASGTPHAEEHKQLAQTGSKMVRDEAKKEVEEPKATTVKVIQAALVSVPGRVHELEVVRKNGKLMWVVEVITPEGRHVMVEVDGITGAVTHTEEKSIETIAGDPIKGKVVFEKDCMVCHGPDGKGTGEIGQSLIPPAANYTSESTRLKTDAELLHTIQEGRPGTAMRSFRKLGLSKQEMRDVLAYVRVLSRGQEK